MNPLWAPLTPVAVRQGQRLLGAMEELAPPAGAPHGLAEAGPTRAPGERLTLTVLGDDMAAGTGASTHEGGLAGQLAALLARARGRDVVWQALGEVGASSLRVHGRMLGLLGASTEVVVLVVGTNDLLARHRVVEWRTEMSATLALLRRHPEVLVCGCPPMGRLPRLRFPMANVLDARAREFDAVTEQLCTESGATFVSLRSLPVASEVMAADGFHPGDAAYRAWAELVAAASVEAAR